MNPILLDIPLQLEAERLLLRAPKQFGDGSIVNEAINKSFNELKTWLPFAQTIPTVEETEVNLREAYINFLKRDSFRFLIFHKGTKDFIGVTSFEGLDWDIPKCHIGYWINTEFSGKGYMLEAVKALCELGLNHIKFKRIEIRCESTNLKSRSIPEKLGFELEGILKNEDFSADGSKLTDTCIYAKV
ncbi:GNAT family N-acetyltransferase [Aquibacillus koreensis]|uniref:GNAT family N-acetyltransferase n=1 Tax=Aquibacillus koreensis TaxID=279446 RepID=A0A9X4AKG1_9BACI|nr:GNAT family N-acetyltransferase [Aquibacillus koreensis]MCT2536242.1 GNAT family N-acetyltransferase [Aquibacillus koreensis]MDC3421405.1 GNAT family N-acetyltransferase [Aquibacillus koreensis]